MPASSWGMEYQWSGYVFSLISKKALEVNTYISNTGPSRTMHECFFFALNMNSHFPEAPPGSKEEEDSTLLALPHLPDLGAHTLVCTLNLNVKPQ